MTNILKKIQNLYDAYTDKLPPQKNQPISPCSFWKHILPISLGYSLCSVSETLLFSNPFYTISQGNEGASFFTTIPYNLVITSLCILTLGILLGKLNTLTAPQKLHKKNIGTNHDTLFYFNVMSPPVRLKVQTINILLLLYAATIVLLHFYDQTSNAPSDTSKMTFHSIGIGLILFTKLSFLLSLPPVHTCTVYALTALCDISIFEAARHFTPEYINTFKLAAPLFALALFYKGKVVLSTNRYQPASPRLTRKTLFSPKNIPLYIALCILCLLGTLQLFLNSTIIDIPPLFTELTSSEFRYKVMLIGLCQFFGALFVRWSITSQKSTHSFLITTILVMLSTGTMLQVILADSPIPSLIIITASKLAATFSLVLLSFIIHNRQSIYAPLGTSIFLTNIISYTFAFILWWISQFIQTYSTSMVPANIPIIGIVAILGILAVQIFQYYLSDISRLSHTLNTHNMNSNNNEYFNKLQNLTPREKEILYLVQQGLKNIEISNKLSITESTLRVHLRNTYRKLDIKGRQTLKMLPL